MTDLLVLAMGRLPGGGISIAGMTTEPDPVTTLRWVRPVGDRPLSLTDLQYADGTLVQLGDVIDVELGQPVPRPPHIENIELVGGVGPVRLRRRLAPGRRATFFHDHLDPDPLQVVTSVRARSLCLIQAGDPVASFTLDEETERYEARLECTIAGRRSASGVLVTDIFWRAWGRQWLVDDPFVEIGAAELKAELGDLYVVVSLNSKGAPTIAGVHPLRPAQVELDPEQL